MAVDWTVTIVAIAVIVATIVWYIYKVSQWEKQDQEAAKKEGRLSLSERRRINQMDLGYGTQGHLKEGGRENGQRTTRDGSRCREKGSGDA